MNANTFFAYASWVLLAYLLFSLMIVGGTIAYAYLLAMGAYGLAFVKGD